MLTPLLADGEYIQCLSWCWDAPTNSSLNLSPIPLKTHKEFANKKVVIVGVPGAFTRKSYYSLTFTTSNI